MKKLHFNSKYHDILTKEFLIKEYAITKKTTYHHHIDYDKNNLDPKNLISLCKSHHMKSNYNRETYIKFFRILKENKICQAI